MATDTVKKKKKKKMKKGDWYFLVGLVILAIAAGSYVLATWDWPSHDPKDLLGKWLLEPSNVAIESESGYSKYSSMYWVFAEDGTLTVENASGDAGSGSYSINGESITLTFGQESQTLKFVIWASKLTLGEGDDAFSLAKAK